LGIIREKEQLLNTFWQSMFKEGEESFGDSSSYFAFDNGSGGAHLRCCHLRGKYGRANP